MQYHVVKLGGTSQCKAGYLNLLKVAKSFNESDKDSLIVVLSAVSNVTNLLVSYSESFTSYDIDIINHSIKSKYINLIKALFEEDEEAYKCILQRFTIFYNSFFEEVQLTECSNQIEIEKMSLKSQIIGFGEVLSTFVLSEYFTYNNVENTVIDAYKFIVNKEESYRIYPITEFVADLDLFSHEISGISPKSIIITQGFIGRTPSGQKVLLGRGGSDTTGSLIASMLDAKEYQVWTDVNGIYSCDPRIISDAKPVKYIDYKLAQEISSMGAKVMHPLSIYPCEKKNIPIYVKNTFDIDGDFTIIHSINKFSSSSSNSSTFIASQKNITVFKITSLNMWGAYGFVSNVFELFTKKNIDVNIITTSQFQICTTTDFSDKLKLFELKFELSKNYDVEMIDNCEIVSVVSDSIQDTLKNINFKYIQDKLNSHIIHIGSNSMTLNIVCDKKHVTELYNYLYKVLVA